MQQSVFLEVEASLFLEPVINKFIHSLPKRFQYSTIQPQLQPQLLDMKMALHPIPPPTETQP